MNIEDICVNVIAERDGKCIAFTFPSRAPRKNVRAAENKYLKISSGKPVPLNRHMELARDPINTIGKHLSTKYALNKKDIAFLRLRMIGLIDIMNKHGHVGPDGINISLDDFEPIEQTRICSVDPYDFPKLKIDMEEEPLQDYDNDDEIEDVEMPSFTSSAMVTMPTPISVEKMLVERCPEHILSNKKWKREIMLYGRCKPREFIVFLNRCDNEIRENEDAKQEFFKFNAENTLHKMQEDNVSLKETSDLEKLKVTNELEKLKVQETSELEKLKVEVEKIKETNRPSLADKKIERVKQECLKIKAEYQKLSLMKKQKMVRPATVEEVRATNVRVIPNHADV